MNTIKVKMLKIIVPCILVISLALSSVALINLNMFSQRVLESEINNGFTASRIYIKDYFWGIEARMLVFLNSNGIQEDIENNKDDFLKAAVKGLNTSTDLIVRTYIRTEDNKTYTYPQENIYDFNSAEHNRVYEIAKNPDTLWTRPYKDPVTGEYIEGGKSQDAIWVGPYKDSVTGEEIITLNKGIFTEDKKFLGSMGIDVKFKDLAKFTAEKIFSETGHTILVDKNMRVVSNGVAEESVGKTLENEVIKKRLQEEEAGCGEELLYGQKYLYKFIQQPKSELKILTVISSNEYSLVVLLGMILQIVLTIILVAITCYIVNRFSTKLQKNIVKINSKLNEIGDGNLTSDIEISSKDEFEVIGNHINTMTHSFSEIIKSDKNIVGRIKESTSELSKINEDVSDYSKRIHKEMEEIVQVTTTQAKDIESIVNEVNNLSSGIKIMDEKLLNSTKLCNETNENSNNGGKLIDILVETSFKTKGAVLNIGNAIQEVENSSEKIRGILDVITQISTQTNLLSLNASIEAARVGDQGKGFAVVANEIRKLSEESKNASIDINNIINMILSNMVETVKALEEITNYVDIQSGNIDNTQQSFIYINDSINKLMEQIHNLGDLNSNILMQKDNIQESIHNLAKGIDNTKESTEEVTELVNEQVKRTESSEELTFTLLKESRAMNKNLEKFKIE